MHKTEDNYHYKPDKDVNIHMTIFRHKNLLYLFQYNEDQKNLIQKRIRRQCQDNIQYLKMNKLDRLKQQKLNINVKKTNLIMCPIIGNQKIKQVNNFGKYNYEPQYVYAKSEIVAIFLM